MNWNTPFRSIYYDGAPEPVDPALAPKETALFRKRINLLLPRDEQASQLVPELAPVGDEIVVAKTTDSALTGTNLRLVLNNLGVKNVACAGIFRSARFFDGAQPCR